MPPYDRFPETRIEGFDGAAFEGAGAVAAALADVVHAEQVLCVETYPGVEDEALDLVREAFAPDEVLLSKDAFLGEDELMKILRPHMTGDRVRGVMFHGTMEDLMDPVLLADARARLDGLIANGRRVLVYGMGASLIAREASLVYCDMARWEIELRQRAGAPNALFSNPGEDALVKNKIGYFIEWLVADKRKRASFDRAAWFIDTCERGRPRLVAGDALRAGLAQIARRPFRLVPYFDPGVWGGHWMQERFGLDPDKPNYAWSFDGVPEENSLYLRFGGVRVEVPAMDLVLMHPRELLGEHVFARFGAEFPIRFDFLDTMGGEALSLQVHPTADYILNRFGMAYTQDESYYILDAGEGAGVYLGIRDGVDPEEMMAALREAQAGGAPFDAGSYINFFPAKAGDHFLIPAGTVHCSASNTVVLEISATPYIFTFKMWDWGRLGMDGLPRPIHIDDAEAVIDWNRRTEFCTRELVNATNPVAAGEGWHEEHTGLHELEFIEVRRFTASVPTDHDASAGVNVLNLVGGGEALVESPDGAFQPFEVHGYETFIVPAGAGRYRVVPRSGEIVFVKAFVRS